MAKKQKRGLFASMVDFVMPEPKPKNVLLNNPLTGLQQTVEFDSYDGSVKETDGDHEINSSLSQNFAYRSSSVNQRWPR